MRMQSLATSHDIPFTLPLRDWTASPIAVSMSPYQLCYLTALVSRLMLFNLTPNCGLWVLASALAILHGFDACGLAEDDMPWFRTFLTSLVMQIPQYPY